MLLLQEVTTHLDEETGYVSHITKYKLPPFIEINAQVCGKLKENSISFNFYDFKYNSIIKKVTSKWKVITLNILVLRKN